MKQDIFGFRIFGFLILFVILLCGCGAQTGTKSITISPSTISIGINKTQQFYATAFDYNNKVVTKTFTWTAGSAIGTIDANGLFYAGINETSGSVTASVDGLTATATVTLTTKGSVTGRITNSQSERVSGLQVYISSIPTLSAFTDATGLYTISDVPYGTQEVTVKENVLYLLTTVEANITTGETATAGILLSDRISLSGSPAGDPLSVSGHATNNGSTTAAGVTVIYTFTYTDADGNTATAVGSQAVGDIAAGATVQYSITPTPSITTYSAVIAKGIPTSF